MAWDTLIEFLTRSHQSGYVARDAHTLAFFSNNTLCVRRRAAIDARGYDPRLQASEDVDFCTRIAKNGWRLYRSPDMTLEHRPRPSLITLLKQWWGYGWNIPGVFKRHNPATWEVYLAGKGNEFTRLFYRGHMPFSCCIFIHSYSVGFLALAGVPFALLLGCSKSALVLGAIWLLCAALYLRVDFRGGFSIEQLQTAGIRLLVNTVFTCSHLLGGLLCGCPYLPQIVSDRKD